MTERLEMHCGAVNYDPCGTCHAGMNQGIALIECTQHPMHNNQREIQQGVYPTGSWCVLTEDAVKRIFDAGSAKNMLQHRRAFVEPGLLEQIGAIQPAATAPDA